MLGISERCCVIFFAFPFCLSGWIETAVLGLVIGSGIGMDTADGFGAILSRHIFFFLTFWLPCMISALGTWGSYQEAGWMDNGHDESNLTSRFTFYFAAVSLYSFINK